VLFKPTVLALNILAGQMHRRAVPMSHLTLPGVALHISDETRRSFFAGTSLATAITFGTPIKGRNRRDVAEEIELRLARA